MKSRALNALVTATFATTASTAFAADSAPTSQFRSLDKIAAVPMSLADLSSVRGEHVHFFDPGGGKIHLAGSFADHDGDGDPDNWIPGGSDGHLVAPSYRGLCVSVGAGGVSIPQVATQC